MPEKKISVRVIMGCLILLFLILSFYKLFPSHPMGHCPDVDASLSVKGPVHCPNQANFWQWLADDLKYFDGYRGVQL